MLCTLCICLMVAANIEEKNTIRESREEISSAYVISAADKAEVPVAGVCRVLSGYSFTTESDEATGITKNPRTMVASTAPSDAAEEVQTPLEEAETPEAFYINAEVGSKPKYRQHRGKQRHRRRQRASLRRQRRRPVQRTAGISH